MVESNFDILGLKMGASQKEIRDAFRRLVLDHHSDRGGDEEKTKRIIQAYEDLKQGKAYPDTDIERLKKSKVYDDDDRRRKNLVLSGDVAREMQVAQEWAGLLRRSEQAGSRLFGSKELGEMEFEIKQSGQMHIKGKYWAGHLTYDGPITMAGSITNPYFAPEESTKTVITVVNGNFEIVDPIRNNFVIENGAKIIAENGDIVVGNMSGVKELQQDPQGRVGLYLTKEHFTELRAPKGKIVAGTARETVLFDADTVVVNNLINNVKVRARIISIFGSTVNYNCELELRSGGYMEFHDEGSGFALSDDALVRLENGKWFKLRDLKTSNLVGHGRQITYEYLDGLGKKKEGSKSGFGLLGIFKKKKT